MYKSPSKKHEGHIQIKAKDSIETQWKEKLACPQHASSFQVTVAHNWNAHVSKP